MIASFARAAGPGAGHQPQVRGEVAWSYRVFVPLQVLV